MDTDRTRNIGLMVGASLALLIVAIVQSSFADTERALHLSLKCTARLSFLLWWTTFVASSFAKRGPRRLGKLLCARRSSIGLAFVGAHAVHFSMLLTLLALFPHTRVPPLFVAFGGFGLAYVAVLGVTSYSRPRRALGARWRTIHRFGTWYVGLIFAYGILRNPIVRGQLLSAWYLPFFLLMVLGVAARAWSAWRVPPMQIEGRV